MANIYGQVTETKKNSKKKVYSGSYRKTAANPCLQRFLTTNCYNKSYLHQFFS
jgi:hypothetical protein